MRAKEMDRLLKDEQEQTPREHGSLPQNLVRLV